MKSEIKKLDGSKLEITIEENKWAIAKYREKAIKEITKTAEIKGFRKWAKIPESIIIKTYWDGYIEQVAIENAIDDLYKKSLKENKILPLAQANIKEIKSQDPLVFVAEVEVYPEVEISDEYKKIKIKSKAIKVTKKEVTEAIEDIQKRLTNFEGTTKAYKAKNGDKVTIDTDGYEGETLLDSTSMRDYPLVLGSGTLVPGFEEGIVWAKTGEELSLDIVFPADYHNADFANKATVFKVKIIKIEKSVKPEITPDFVEKIRGQRLEKAEFEELVKKEITETKESNALLENEQKLIEELEKISTLDFGENLLKASINKVLEEIKQNVASQWGKFADYIASLWMSEEEYIEQNVKEVATKRLKGELLLEKLKTLVNIEISDDEMKEEIDNVIAKYENPDVKKRLAELYTPGTKYYEEIKGRMGYKKIISSFIG